MIRERSISLCSSVICDHTLSLVFSSLSLSLLLTDSETAWWHLFAGEGTDRDFLHLPGSQSELFLAMLATTIASKQKLVVVLINGGPIAIDEIKSTAAAVLVAGFPGQAGGQAIADTLYGANNPSGKLTTTIYPAKYANGEPMSGTPWMDASLRPRAATNLPTSHGRTHTIRGSHHEPDASARVSLTG